MTGENERRLAVVCNPTKISDDLPRMINERAQEQGWAEPLWLETSTDDPGRKAARKALEAGVDLVLVAGGDGTVRAVAAGVSGSEVPLGIIPAGTANLLARNLNIPLTEKEALEVCFGENVRRLDIVRITTDDTEPDRFAVMAGIGLDAAIMTSAETELSTLKEKLGSAAYVVAALKELGRESRAMRIRVDDGPVLRRRAMICLVGNVGAIQNEIELIPEAKPDDGKLDVMVASPSKLRHWLSVLVRLVTRKQLASDRVDQLIGRRVEVVLEEPDEYELDGDTMGSCQRLVAEVEPQALIVRVPEKTSS